MAWVLSISALFIIIIGFYIITFNAWGLMVIYIGVILLATSCRIG